MTDQTAKKCKKVLRNNEYYSFQAELDYLYRASKEGRSFKNLMRYICCQQNVELAYRRIKRNKGSRTSGTNKNTIDDIAKLGTDKLVAYVKTRLDNYKPHSVRRVMIPKDNGKERPLGIPTIEDRLIQQCILQILEPICEAKFHKHSYGFRPNRKTHNAIARFSYLVYHAKLEYVVDIDIKGFFDNVNHAKLIKQMWSLGIRDKNLLSIISKLLKAPIVGEGVLKKGTPQGGILSPLLSNIVLNELDWWISNQWETFPTRHPYKGSGDKYQALKRSSNLKEMYLVRYADDFKILCRNRNDAEKIKIAIEDWLKQRLKLETSPEKSKITNLRKHYSEFLGFKLKIEERPDRNVVISHMTDKAKKKVIDKLRTRIRNVKSNKQEVVKLNSAIRGMHNYYCTATRVSEDFWEIYYILLPTLKHITKSNGKKGPPQSAYQLKRYGGYKVRRFTVGDMIIDPISAVKFTVPRGFNQDICNYTDRGRELIHRKICKLEYIFEYLSENPLPDESAEFNDNVISKISAQRGRCSVSKKQLTIEDITPYRIKKDGGDGYRNIIVISKDIYGLIMEKDISNIQKMVQKLEGDRLWNKKVRDKTNKYRELVGNAII